MAKTDEAAGEPAAKAEGTGSAGPRKIPGNLPYLAASGTLKKALDRLIEAQQPPKFSADFLEDVLSLKGGAARATIPILKKMGFVASDGTPTELYAKFRTVGGRGQAALQGLQNGFGEIFRRSTYAHTASDAKLKDIIVEITGLAPNDPVAQAIKGTFNVVKSYVPGDIRLDGGATSQASAEQETPSERTPSGNGTLNEQGGQIRLAYNINIVLPETSDLNVLNAIFRSIRENLMK